MWPSGRRMTTRAAKCKSCPSFLKTQIQEMLQTDLRMERKGLPCATLVSLSLPSKVHCATFLLYLPNVSPSRSILRFHLQRDVWRLGWSTMKLLAFSLALAIFAGSWALVIREAPDQENQTKLAKLTHELEKILDEITNATEKKWEHFKHSKTGKALIKLLDDEDEAPSEGKDKASPKEDEDIVDTMIDVLGDVIDAAEDAVVEIGKQALPIFKTLGKAMETAVGKHLDPMIEKVEPHMEHLLHTLVNKVHELDHKLEEVLPQQLELLDSHAHPYIQKLAELDSKNKAATK